MASTCDLLGGNPDTPEDEAYNFYLGIIIIWINTPLQNITKFIDMLFSGVVQCGQKLATQHGACRALLAFWKHAMGNYHEAKKVL